MSFWSTIGDIFTGGGGNHEAASGSLNIAQAASASGLSVDDYNQMVWAKTHSAEAESKGVFKTHPDWAPGHNNFLANSGVVQGAISGANGAINSGISALSFVPNLAAHALSAGYNVGDVANANGQSQWHPLVSLQDWKNAWNATSGFMAANSAKPSFGASVVHTVVGGNAPTGGVFGNSAANKAYLAGLQHEQATWTGKIASGVIDTAATWYADPTLLAAKGATRTRVGIQVPDAAAATEAVAGATAINAGEMGAAHNPFSTGMERAGSNLFKFVKTTDNGANRAGRQVLLDRTPETAPVLGLLDQADKIADLDLQRQVKIDILGAASDSDVARQRLVGSAPEIARAVQRASLAPEGREALDNLHDALATADHSDPSTVAALGQAWVDSATSFGTTENRAEIAALHAKHLKSIHDSFDRLNTVAQNTPLETAGLTALDRAKAALRNHVADDFHFQDGPSSRTVRLLNWSTNQRFRGTIATDHSIRGNQELMDWMKRAKIVDEGKPIPLFNADERLAASDAFLTAKTQEQRRRQVDQLWTTMYAKVGAHHGLDPKVVKSMAQKGQTIRQGSVRYTTKELEKARMTGDDVVTLEDPATGTPTRLKASLLETHIANNISLPDPDFIQRAVRRAQAIPYKGDDVAYAASQFNNLADHFNDVWRLSVLGRPGLLIRTQVDSQGRALAVMGGTAHVHSALTGIKNWTGRDLSRQGFTPEALAYVDATAADHALADSMELEAARLNHSASQGEAVARVRRGASAEGVNAPTLQDRGEILRDHEKNTDLPLDADAIANMSPAARRARAKLLMQRADEVRHRQYATDRYRLGTQDERIKLGKGRLVTARAVQGQQDLSDLASAQYKGGRPSEALTQTPPGSMGEVLDRAITREQKRVYEDSGKWVTYAPTDSHWSAGWIRAMDQLRNSYTGRKILDLADTSTTDLVNDLRRDPRVRQEWAEVRGDNRDFDGWLGRTVNTVAWNAPSTEIREALRTRGRMTPDAVDQLFKDSGAQKMYVQGPEFSFDAPEGVRAEGTVHRNVRKMIGALSDVPDSVAARHPVYVDRWRHHLELLGKRQFAQHPEWTELPAATQAKIERVAKHRAIQDVQQTFYDTAKFTGAHNTLRYVSPFVGAWEDAIQSWSRLFYDNPATAGAFNKIWNAPNRMGLVVDQNGDAIAPGQQSDQSFLAVPAEWKNNFKTSKKMTIRKDSLNSIFQGAQWYTPGVGPLIQIPMQEIPAKLFPDLAVALGNSNNPIAKTIYPFGTPKTATGGGWLGNLAADIATGVAPAYARALYSMVNPNDSNNASAYLASVNQQIIEARKAGKPIPTASELDKNASAAARSAGFVRAMSLFAFGVSGQESTVADFYKRQYDLLQSQSADLHAKGTTPSAEFVKQFPEAAGLQWSLSKSATGVNATLKAYQDEKTYAKQIKANPEAGWFYVGADNLNGDFSQSVYNAQSSRTLGIAGSGTERQRLSRTDIISKSLAEDGWLKYNSIKTAVDLKLKQFGLTSLDQNAAANLKLARDQAIQQLRHDNPSWAADFDQQDAGKLQRFIETVATPAISDPALKDRPDIKVLAQYLELRTQAMAKLQSWGYKSLTANAAAPLRAILFQAGQDFANQNLGFQQMWNRMLEKEVGDSTGQAAA
jgi:hypothetical protein